MQWNEAIVVIGRCKRVWTASAARAVERGVLPWICSENPVPKAETTPLKRYTRRAWDARDPESLLQCQNMSFIAILYGGHLRIDSTVSHTLHCKYRCTCVHVDRACRKLTQEERMHPS